VGTNRTDGADGTNLHFMKTTTTKRRKRVVAVKGPALVVVNLAEMGARPSWETVQGFFSGLAESQRAVLMHWLALHLASARMEHEADPLAPANFRDHCCGRAAEVNQIMAEARLMMQCRGDDAGDVLRSYFGGKRGE
jgi:hypothetical protein